MIKIRHAHVYLYIIFSNLFICFTGYATNIQTNYNLHKKEISYRADETLKIAKQELTISNSNSEIEENRKSGRALSLLVMGITLIVYFTILNMLFKEGKKPKSKQSRNKIKNNKLISREIPTFRPEDSLYIIDDINSLNHILNSKELKLKKKPINTINYKKSEAVKKEDKVKINPNVMGKLTVVEEVTTEIDFVSELIQDLQQNGKSANLERQKDLRRKAIWELGKTNDFRAVEPLIQIISRVDSLEKNLILDAITRIANHSLETVNDVFLTSLEDNNVEVRKNAIQDLTSLYCSMALITEHLSNMTKDSNQEIQQTAKWALKQFKKFSVPVTSTQSRENEK